jgi:hypothetical protein
MSLCWFFDTDQSTRPCSSLCSFVTAGALERNFPTQRDDSQIFSLWPILWDVKPRPCRANIRAYSRPFVLPRPDEEFDPCFFDVNPHFDSRMQVEDRKNVIVDSVVFARNAMHGVHLHGVALATEMRLAIRLIAYPVRMGPLSSAQSNSTANAESRKLHVPIS